MATVDPALRAQFDAWWEQATKPAKDALWARTAELWATRAELRLAQAQLADAERALADCLTGEEPPPQPPPPPAVDFATRAVVWLPSLREADWRALLNQDLARVRAVVGRPDMAFTAWGAEVLAQLAALGKEFWAYIRSPLHTATAPTSYSAYEIGVKDLAGRKNAWVRWATTPDIPQDRRGTVMQRSGGFDADTVPWAMFAEHAALTIEAAQRVGGKIIVDGVPTWQIYATDPAAADYDGDGVADAKAMGFEALATKQHAALVAWLNILTGAGLQIICNNAWEPADIALTPRDGGQRWEFAGGKPFITPATFWEMPIAGIMSEDGSFPYYHRGHPYQQGPKLSETWHVHMAAAWAMKQRGKRFWMMGNYKLFAPPLTAEQARRFRMASALLVDADVVVDAPGDLALNLGKPLGPARAGDVTFATATGNWGALTWVRDFEHGRVVCNASTKEAQFLPT
jgi:hypothetical protein